MVRFNVDINPDEINEFAENSYDDDADRFITSEKYLNDIKYSNTISIFQDLNCLYFIFYEEKNKKGTSAGTSAGAGAGAGTSANKIRTNVHNDTKKIIAINIKNNKKTRRVRLI